MGKYFTIKEAIELLTLSKEKINQFIAHFVTRAKNK
jgi:hypothetical protein